jgi:hypothetical protein
MVWHLTTKVVTSLCGQRNYTMFEDSKQEKKEEFNMLKLKKVISIALSFLMILSINSFDVQASSDGTEKHNDQMFVMEAVEGFAIPKSQETVEIESSSIPNSRLEYVNLSINFENANLETIIENQVVVFKPRLHQNTLGNNFENSIFGVDETVVSGIQLVRFSVERNTEEFSLIKPNFHMKGKTVVSLGFYSYGNDTTYLYQFAVDELSIPTVGESDLSENILVEHELANFAGKPYQEVSAEMQEFEFSFEVENISVTGEQVNNSRMHDFSKSGNTEFDILEKTPEELLFDQYIEASKKGAISLESGRNARNVVTGIPDSLYKTRKSGWTTTAPAYVGGNSIGYAIYHMPAIGSNNTLNYVARVQASTNFNWNSQRFISSFKITHNVWVQYIASSNSVYIFDDRAWNARLDFEAEVFLSTPNNKTGYFTHYSPSSISNNSKLSRIANASIIWIPYVSSGIESWNTLTDAKRVTGTTHPLNLYTKRLDGTQSRLQYPNDHVTIEGIGKNINEITYGYSYTVWAR